MPTVITPLEQFPHLTPQHILAFQFSSWYPYFSAHSIKSTIIRPLSDEFREYLDSEGVFIPEGAEDLLVVSLSNIRFTCNLKCWHWVCVRPIESSLSDQENEDEDEDEVGRKKYTFPELDAKIREAVSNYGAVFPKLNFSSPRVSSSKHLTFLRS